MVMPRSIHIREQAIGNQQALTAASWRDEIDEHIKNDQLNCDKAKFATEQAKAILRDARSADNKATAQQALKVANDALMAADNSKRCSKVSRANAVAPLLEAGQLGFCHGNDDLITELLGFPNAAHDDLVDAFCQGVIWLQNQHWRGSGSTAARPLLFSR